MKTARDIALRFIARYRDAFPDVLDIWPTDRPMPNFPGIITRLGLADELARVIEAYGDERAAKADSALRRIEDDLVAAKAESDAWRALRSKAYEADRD